MKNKRKTRKFNIGFCFAMVLAVYLVFAMINQQSVLTQNAKEISELSAQKAQTEQTLDDLNDTADVYSSDEFVEKVARDELGLVRPDETVFIDVTNE